MSNYSIILLTVIVIYLVFNLVFGIYASRNGNRAKANHPLSEFFIGGRSMGGLVLAMTLVATFTSASSFIGGPGIAASKGLVWVYISIIQIPTAFIILAVLGKKLAILSRQTGAITVTELLWHRYKSHLVVVISSLALVIFFVAQMMSQFIGGAVLLQTITGLPYIYGLLIFAAVVIIYTSVGGFKAVVVTDTIQGLVMVVGGILLLGTVIYFGGGSLKLAETMDVVSPSWKTIDAGGTIEKPYVLSFWVLVGLGTLGLPQTAVRGMGFKDTKSLHKAMIYSTLVMGFIMLVMHLSGVYAPALLQGENLQNSDYVVVKLVTKFMNPIVAGVFIAAPLAAVMSTVSSLLIMVSSTIVKDLYVNYFIKEGRDDKGRLIFKSGKKSLNIRHMRGISSTVTLVSGAAVVILTISPPDLIVWINLFALGGLECGFFAPIIMGLYWKRTTGIAAFISSAVGMIAFIVMSQLKISIIGMMPVIPALIISVVICVIVTLLTNKAA